MSTTSKSPKRVVEEALAVGEQAFPDYSHRFSPKKFTQPQLFAGLVLKEFLRLDYRKLTALLADASELAAAIGLVQVPHFTTFQKAAERLLRSPHVKELLDAALNRARQRRLLANTIDLAAVDGSGFEARQASHYYVRRRAKGGKTWQDTTYTRFPKAVLVSDCASHFILSIVTGRGPSPDIPYFRAALRQAIARLPIRTLAADAGFDAEHAHEFARQTCGVKTLIPARIGRPTAKKPSGRWRRSRGGPFARHPLQPTLAVRNRQQHAQTTAGPRAARSVLLVANPRTALTGAHP